VTRDAHIHLEATARLAGVSFDQDTALSRTLTDLVFGSAAHGATAVDVRYNPRRWDRRGCPVARQLAQLRAVGEWALAAQGVELRVLVTLKREADPADWEFAVEAASAGVDAGIVGVDVSRAYDPTRPCPPEAPAGASTGRLVEIVRAAGATGLVTAWHLGWWDGPADVELALAAGATRIGHGVPLVDDDRWDGAFAALGALIEVCPSAFVRNTGRPVRDLPLDRWAARGLRVAVGTDHPVAWGLRLDDEIDAVGRGRPLWGVELAGRRAAVDEENPIPPT
jgi:adenosine deaminase